uniref:Roadblock/LAMTOR2 domain-containing protein n=1 Tax=Acrobeloides nanus TaxID=290746 RepID=A0A914DQG8_9BILA
MGIKIAESLERIVQLTPEVNSILVVDKDGVPVVSSGVEMTGRSQLIAAYTSSVEHANKLNMGAQKSWSLLYETQQLVILNEDPFVVFIMASPSANTGLLCTMGAQLRPILNECQQVVEEVLNLGLQAGRGP